MSRDGSRRKLETLEKRLTAMVATDRCTLCSLRTGRCSECGRPLGPTDGEYQELRAKMDATLDRYRVRYHQAEEVEDWASIVPTSPTQHDDQVG